MNIFEYPLQLFRFEGKYIHQLLADVEDARLVEQPTPGVNHAAWLVGHLAIANDYALALLGQPTVCPPEWSRVFDPGTQPTSNREEYPPKHELLSKFDEGAAKAATAIAKMTPEQLAATNPVDWLRAAFPTVGVLMIHLLTTHIATHVGQLSAWRRQVGLPPAKGVL